jgi:hypothetical protein
MSQLTTNENSSLSISIKKPLAFVQPVIRDSSPSSSRSMNPNSFSYANQSRKLSMNKRTDFNDHEK